jgi:hypothetical protein
MAEGGYIPGDGPIKRWVRAGEYVFGVEQTRRAGRIHIDDWPSGSGHVEPADDA